MHGLCYTCLSQDRNVKLLNSFLIKSLLWGWFEAAGNNFQVKVDEFKLCWECIASFVKICKFKRQVFKAQQIRLKVAQKKAAHLIKLSKLSVYTKDTYDITYVHSEGSNDLRTIVSDSEPILVDSSSNDSNDSKKSNTPKPGNGKHKVYMPLRKNKAKIFSKRSKHADRVEKKKKAMDLYVENNNNNNTDSNNSKKTETAKSDKERLDLLATGREITREKENSSSRISEENNEKIFKKLKTDDTHHQTSTTTTITEQEIMGSLACPTCETRFKKENFLQLHNKTHYRSYKCGRCDFQHHRRYVIETHLVKEHELKPAHVCPDCDMEFDTQPLLISHYEVAHKERLKCNICGECFDTCAGVRTHAATHKGAEGRPVIVEIFHCAHCNSTFEGKATYRTHMQFTHTSLAQNAYCADCDVQFSNIHRCNQHLEESEKHSLLVNMEFDCAYCKSKFPTKDGLLAHIVRAHRLLSQICALCDKGFSDLPRLKDHIQAEHPEVIAVKPVKDKVCPICSKAYLARRDLLDHMRTHRARKPFDCKQCEKRFAAKTLLKKHIRRKH